MSEADDLQNLAQQLLRRPFDAGLRARYAAALMATGDEDAALEQAELLCEQPGHEGAGHALAARVLRARGDTPGALGRYRRAQRLPGFAADATLDALLASAAGSPTPSPGRLVAIEGGRGAPNVRSIRQVEEEKVRFSSIVGMDALKKTIRLKIIEPYLNPGLFARFRLSGGGGILLYGPPGCGKTMLARAVANECDVGFLAVGIADVLTLWLGESERNLAGLFDKARAQAPCVLFFDELDALAYARSKSTTASTRTIVNEFLTQLDGIGRENRGVLVLAATNMPWDVDGAMKRPGRFSRQIFVPPPDAEAREAMLSAKLAGVPLEGTVALGEVARRSEHFSGADIDGLIELAKERALEDALSGQERGLRMDDFDAGLERMQPSTLDWLRTVRNVVKYAGDDGTYKDVEQYLRRSKLL